jgi:outer membrane protein
VNSVIRRKRHSPNYQVLGAVIGVLILSIATSKVQAQDTIIPGQKLTLEQAIELTLRNHPRGLEMESEAAEARARIGEAQSALMPQVYGAGEYLRSTDNPIGNTTYYNPGFIPRITGTLHGGSADARQSFSTTDNFVAGVGGQQYLFDFGRVHGLIRERSEETHAALLQVQLTDLDLIFEVTQRYFALLAAEQKIKVYEKAVEQRSEQLHDAKVKAEADLAPQIDVVTAQAALTRSRTNLLEASDDRATARVALDNTMAVSPNAPPYELADVLAYKPLPGSVESYFALALEHRPDLAILKAHASAAGAQINEVRSDFFPSAQAVAGYTTMGTGLPAANNFNVGVVISWPIFNGFLTARQLDEANARRNSINYAIKDLQLRIWLEVKSAYLQLQTSVDRIHQAEDTLKASSDQLELAEKRYDAGLGNIIELTDAERFYVQDEAAYVDALYAYSVIKAGLDHSTGASVAQRTVQ